jgi:hypothetical protein
MPSGIRLKTVQVPRNQNRSRSLSRLRARNPRTKGPLSPETIATSEDAGTGEGHEPCGMPCEAFAHSPQEQRKGLRCGAARRPPRAPGSPPPRPGRGMPCLDAGSAVRCRLRSTHDWPSKPHCTCEKESGRLNPPYFTLRQYCPLGQPQAFPPVRPLGRLGVRGGSLSGILGVG